MPEIREITCINKPDHNDPYSRITHVGGGATLLTGWRMTVEEAIDAIEKNRIKFQVGSGLMAVDVIVATGPSGRKHLTTSPDDETSNNLLSLPECPP